MGNEILVRLRSPLINFLPINFIIYLPMDLIFETCFLFPQIFPPLEWPNSCLCYYSFGQNLPYDFRVLVTIDDYLCLLRSGSYVSLIISVKVNNGLLFALLNFKPFWIKSLFLQFFLINIVDLFGRALPHPADHFHGLSNENIFSFVLWLIVNFYIQWYVSI